MGDRSCICTATLNAAAAVSSSSLSVTHLSGIFSALQDFFGVSEFHLGILGAPFRVSSPKCLSSRYRTPLGRWGGKNVVLTLQGPPIVGGLPKPSFWCFRPPWGGVGSSKLLFGASVPPLGDGLPKIFFWHFRAPSLGGGHLKFLLSPISGRATSVWAFLQEIRTF